MFIRSQLDSLIKKLSYAPVVAILGPRQVGKTTIAKQAAEAIAAPFLYLDLERASDLQKLEGDAESFLRLHSEKLIILDEVQLLPTIFNVLRPIIDEDRRAGRFLLLGSASPHLVKGVSESLAGRISYLDLPPLHLREIYPTYSLEKHWFRGGFPQAFLAPLDEAFTDWAESFVRAYVERDLNHLFGYSLNPVLIKKMWYMLAYGQGNILNAQDMGRSLGVTAPIVKRYLEILEGAFLIRKLLPWSTNMGKRLVKSPKIYLRDSGILHFLQGINSIEELMMHPIVGASWEGYVIEQIYSCKPQHIELYFYRTHVGAELDVLLTKGHVPIAAIEIKRSNAPSVSRGFYSAILDVGTTKNYIITPSSEEYPHKEAWVCALPVFLEQYLPGL